MKIAIFNNAPTPNKLGLALEDDAQMQFSSFLSIDELRNTSFDALVLDASAPHILPWARAHLPPHMIVIMSLDAAEAPEAARWLSRGADECLIKPLCGIHLKEVLQRHATLLEQSKSQADSRFSALGFEFDPQSLSIFWQQEQIQCSAPEFALASLFCRNAARALSREEIYTSVYMHQPAQTGRALDALIYRTRSKLKLDERRGLVVQPIHGFGYRLNIV